MISCHDASFLISKKEDTRLTFSEKIKLKMHLMGCYLCRRFQKEIAMLSESTDALAKDHSLKLKLSDKQKHKLAEALKCEMEDE